MPPQPNELPGTGSSNTDRIYGSRQKSVVKNTNVAGGRSNPPAIRSNFSHGGDKTADKYYRADPLNHGESPPVPAPASDSTSITNTDFQNQQQQRRQQNNGMTAQERDAFQLREGRPWRGPVNAPVSLPAAEPLAEVETVEAGRNVVATGLVSLPANPPLQAIKPIEQDDDDL